MKTLALCAIALTLAGCAGKNVLPDPIPTVAGISPTVATEIAQTHNNAVLGGFSSEIAERHNVVGGTAYVIFSTCRCGPGGQPLVNTGRAPEWAVNQMTVDAASDPRRTVVNNTAAVQQQLGFVLPQNPLGNGVQR